MAAFTFPFRKIGGPVCSNISNMPEASSEYRPERSRAHFCTILPKSLTEMMSTSQVNLAAGS